MAERGGSVTVKDIAVLVRALYGVKAEWKRFGVALGVNYDTIQQIERRPVQRGAMDKLIDVLDRYRRKGGPKRWEDIVRALECVENKTLASQIPQTGDVPVNTDSYINTMLKTYRLEEEAAGWKRFGLQLNIPLNELEEIDEGRLDVDECMTELLLAWIQGQKVATVSDIKRACQSVDNNRLAEELDTNEDIQKIISRR